MTIELGCLNEAGASAPNSPRALWTNVGMAAVNVSRKRRRWAMVIVVISVLCWLWGLFIWFGLHQKQQLLKDRTSELALLGTAVTQQTSALLHTVEGDLRLVDAWLMTHPNTDPLTDSRFLTMVEEMRRSSGGLVDIRIASAAGLIYYLSATNAGPRLDVSDREFFKFHASGPGAQPGSLHVSAPIQSRVDGRWNVPISMRLSASQAVNGPEGRRTADSLQVVYAAVGLELLAGTQENMRFQPDGVISLVRADGIILSRAPAISQFIGMDLSKSEHYSDSFGRSVKGSFVSDGRRTDGVTRLVNFERLRDYPVTVLVSRSLDDVYAMYYSRLGTTIALNAGMTAVVLAITFILFRSASSNQAMHIVQEELRRLATTDELTGAMNRRAFMEAAEREFERAVRYKRPTAVLALDVDHFKRVNDDHGHAIGDEVLQTCTARWLGALRNHDVLGRIGGEEFCILLPETNSANAAMVAERLVRLTNAAPMADGRCMVSVSIGWTVIQDLDSVWSNVLERADRALYAAKNGGRNCVRPSTLPADEMAESASERCSA